MKIALIIISAIFFVSCSKKDESEQMIDLKTTSRIIIPKIEDKPIESIEGGWVSERWYMGVAFLFNNDGTFKYWFYSDDKGKDIKYPIIGTWKWNKGVLELQSKDDLIDNIYYVYKHNDEICLLPKYAREWQIKDGKPHEDRLSLKIKKFDESKPFSRK